MLLHLGVLVVEPDRLLKDASDPLCERLDPGQPAGEAVSTADATRDNPDQGLPLLDSRLEEWTS